MKMVEFRPFAQLVFDHYQFFFCQRVYLLIRDSDLLVDDLGIFDCPIYLPAV
jgi:hypothetical protein